MATLEEVKEEIGQLRLEQDNKLTRLETEVKEEIGQLRLEHGNKLTHLETEIGQLRLEHGTQLTRLETLVEPMSEQLKKIEESLRALERSHAEHKGMVVGARWIIGVGLAVLAACGGVAGAVVSHVLK